MMQIKTFFNFLAILGLAKLGQVGAKDLVSDAHDYLYDLTAAETVRKDYGEFMDFIRNPEVDPCEDFYAYACGNFHKLNFSNTFQLIEIKKEKLLESFIEKSGVEDSQIESKFKFEGEESASLTPSERKAISFFQSCMKKDLINDRKLEAVKGFLKTIDGYPLKQEERGGMGRPGMGRPRPVARPGPGIGRPNFQESQGPEFDWVNMSAYLRSFGIDAIFSLHIENGMKYFDLDDFQENSAEIKKSVMKCDYERMEFDETRVQEIVEVFADPNVVDRVVRDIVSIDRSLYDTQKGTKKSSVIEYFTFKQLETMLPSLKLLDFMQKFDPAGNYTENDKIGVKNREILNGISESLRYKSADSLKKYLLFRAVYEALLIQDHINVENCLRRTKYFMRLPSDALFLRFYLNENMEKDVSEIFKYIQEEYKSCVEDNQNLEEGRKNKLLNKIEISGVNVGYNKNSKIVEKLESEYSGLEINLDEYFENILKTAEIQQKNVGSWQNYPTDFGIKYDSEHNSFTVQAGTLLIPFYHQGVPMWGKFGNLGTILGKEVSYALELSKSDSNLKPDLKSMVQHFSKTLCFARKNKNFKGLSDVNSYIADVKGVKLSFEAYKKWAAENPELSQTESYENLNLSLEQSFFLAASQGVCSKDISETNAIRTRVIHTLQNLKEFSDVYNCPIGSRMNPVDKCSV